MDKRELRLKMKKTLKGIDHVKKQQDENRIYRNLFSHDNWKTSDIIGVTISVGFEIDTTPIIEQAWKEAKTVVVPKCQSRDKTMTFYTLEDFNQLENSFYGLKEPNTDVTEAISPSFIQWLIVPGLIFDRRGYRIGHGGGYYDRFLAKHVLSTVSICMPEQLVESIPNDKFDLPVDFLITPDDVLFTK
ncbi:5-formyltetrahydrofolate cyclo-ligase [Salipaludibacillus daqingensis]|uniref:5-formyltetrahydrofolate cyclo-ligase n=1 Tax=Salipaludibacillus daqingensis TaxID=3041001 RepID=UPI002476C30A|nr:5-formyltetrahydrofolate cyclo-ligase [Salipaludibacillus daqingensis]